MEGRRPTYHPSRAMIAMLPPTARRTEQPRCDAPPTRPIHPQRVVTAASVAACLVLGGMPRSRGGGGNAQGRPPRPARGINAKIRGCNPALPTPPPSHRPAMAIHGPKAGRTARSAKTRPSGHDADRPRRPSMPWVFPRLVGADDYAVAFVSLRADSITRAFALSFHRGSTRSRRLFPYTCLFLLRSARCQTL